MLMYEWELVGKTDHPGRSFVTSDVEHTNLFVAPARLRRRSSRANSGRELLSAKVWRSTYEESFAIRLSDEMTFKDGDVILVLISTETSTSRGYINGHP